ncbi:carboxylesterase family protein [Niastella caeni]|uniref:Carboxylic ester hydrolase n=1 Tax=Niastella caeni TaxID=2569763 RepID=A0A4S8HZC1_9BACT|nr:carboxylesterase family protein [Niastella caeni]THU40189.1 carboxylesterase family protein [Niastella caeni]
MKKWLFFAICFVQFMPVTFAQQKKSSPNNTRVKIANGMLEGSLEETGIVSFKGIPYAAPPVGNLRWKEPQPVQSWKGVRAAKNFGPRAMQPPIFTDMVFRSNGMSEDCLYLNVWTPGTKGKLPVLVYFYGGGFATGDGSEPRYDGESMAQKGIVALTVNYRLGVFGLLAHPELTKESPHHVSGNYGLLDQSAALNWVKQNIAAFGGDPAKITIAGESAGSMSVSAQMASPLSKNLIAGAIGESGSLLGIRPLVPLNKTEENGAKFAKAAGASSLTALRALNADSLLKLSGEYGVFNFPMTMDGYFFPKEPLAIYQAGEQAHVPLLAGWNSEESGGQAIMGNNPFTKDNFKKAVQNSFGNKTEELLKVYAVNSDDEVAQVATDLAGDLFIGFGTWRWTNLHTKTGTGPVYRYYYTHPHPLSKRAVHSAEIQYAMGNLPYYKNYGWTDDDYKVSNVMQQYFVNFIKTGNPNSSGLPNWPTTSSSPIVPVMQIGVSPKVVPAENDVRYEVLQKITQ